MFSQLGQANSEFKVQEWKQQQPNDNLFFHGCRGKLAGVQDETDIECEEIKIQYLNFHK